MSNHLSDALNVTILQIFMVLEKINRAKPENPIQSILLLGKIESEVGENQIT